MTKTVLSVVKVGGNVIENPSVLSALLELFAKMPGKKILVHGGGKKATDLGLQLGITPKIVGGRRITDAASLEIALMVYGGLINKTLVAGLQARGCNAIGLSGADGGVLYAHRRPVQDLDYGFVGDIDGVNQKAVTSLLNAGFVPIFCALTHDGQGQMLNTNADTIASELAIGMSPEYDTVLYYCFEKAGVLSDRDDETSVIRDIDSGRYRELLETGTIAEGMLPKLENCFHALRHQVQKVCIGDIRMLQEGHHDYTTLTL